MSSKHNIIRIRRGTAAEWAASLPQPGGEVLKLGEPGYEKDTGKLKIGDGITPWNSLSYFNNGAAIDPETIQDIIGSDEFMVGGSGINIVYDDDNDNLIISVSGVSVDGHSHAIADVSGLQIELDGKQPSGDYASSIHTHGNISNSGTIGTTPDRFLITTNSGIITTTNSINGTYIYTSYDGQNFSFDPAANIPALLQSIDNAIDVRASGVHTHTSSEITDFDSSVSGLLPVKNISAGSGIVVTSVSGNFTVGVSGTFGVVSTNPDNLSSFVKINNIVSCSQADYDSLSQPDPNTFYIIITIDPPGAPTSLTGYDNMGLYWTAPSSEGGSPITGYKVYATSQSQSETYSNTDVTSLGQFTIPSTVGGDIQWLSNYSITGGDLSWRVSAVNAGGEGPKSDPLEYGFT